MQNTGALTPAALQLQAAETATCSSGTYTAVGGAGGAGAHFAMAASSYLTDGGMTSNVASGLTDPGGISFVGGQVKESAATTGTLNIGTNEFVEVEYSIQATAGATSQGDYCFRLYDAAQQSALGTYTNYAQAQILGVTAVRLLEFEARGAGGAVEVLWQTGQEVRNKGFNVYRASGPFGEFVKLNPELIPSASVSGEGRSYSLPGRRVRCGGGCTTTSSRTWTPRARTRRTGRCVSTGTRTGSRTTGRSPTALTRRSNDAGADPDGDGVANAPGVPAGDRPAQPRHGRGRGRGRR